MEHWRCFCSHLRHVQSGKNFQSKLRYNKKTLPSGFSSHTVNNCSLHGRFSATFFFFPFLCFLWVICYLKCPCSIHAQVLPSVPKCKKALMCPKKYMCCISSLQARTISATSHEFNVIGKHNH